MRAGLPDRIEMTYIDKDISDLDRRFRPVKKIVSITRLNKLNNPLLMILSQFE